MSSFDLDYNEMLDIDLDTGKVVEGSAPKPSPAPKPEDIKMSTTEEFIEIPDAPTKKEDVDDDKSDATTGKATETPPPDETTPSSSLPYKVLINALHEEGVVSDVDLDAIDKLVSEEGYSAGQVVLSIIQNEINNQIDLYKENLPDKIKTLIEKYEEDVPLDEIIKVKSEQTRLEKITEEAIKDSEDIQKRLITTLMKEKGESDTRIEKTLKRLEDLGELEDEALESQKELSAIYAKREKALEDEAKAQRAEQKRRNDEYLEMLKKTVNATDEIVSGLKLSKTEKDSIYKSMTTPVAYREDGRPLSSVNITMSRNPVAFEMALHYYHELGLFNIDKDGNFKPDFSKITKTAKTTAIQELEKTLTGGEPSLNLKPGQTKKDDSRKQDLIKGIEKFVGQR